MNYSIRSLQKPRRQPNIIAPLNDGSVLYWRFLVSLLFAVTFALPLNLILKGPGINAWKQILMSISVLGVIFIYARPASKNSAVISYIKFGLVINAVWILTALASYLNNVPIQRVVYSYFYYVAEVPFGFIPFLALYLGKQRKMVNYLLVITLITGIGLIIDFRTNIFSFFAQPIATSALSDWAYMRDVGFRRAQFLFETSSNCFSIISVGIVFSVWCFLKTGNVGAKSLYILVLVAGSLGIVVTQTRAQWIGLALLWASMAITMWPWMRNRALVYLTLIACFTGVVLGGMALSRSYGEWDTITKRASDITSAYDAGNDVRFLAWQNGLALMKDPYRWLVGSGVGAAAGQIEVQGVQSDPHYESSLLSAFNEAGALGLFLRYGPMILALWNLVTKNALSTALGRLLALWFFIWFIVTAAAPSAVAYHALAAEFIVLGVSYNIKAWDVVVMRDLRKRV